MKRVSVLVVFLIVLFSFSVLGAQDEPNEPVKKEPVKKSEEKKPEEKKYTVEVSVGMSRINPQDLYMRSAGIDTLVTQYAGHYQMTAVSTGEFKQNKLMIPINVSVAYALKEKYYLRAGLELAFSSSTSQKEFQLEWDGAQGGLGLTETQQYDLTYNISYFMPRVGGGYRINDTFDIYGSLGLAFTRFAYTEDFGLQMGSGSMQSVSTEYKGSGTAPAIIVGARLGKTFKKIRAFVKVEALILKTGWLKGSRKSSPSNSDDVSSGTFYTYQWNPFRKSGFDFWDVYETEPTSMDKLQVDGLSLNLSSIRLMLGIAF